MHKHFKDKNKQLGEPSVKLEIVNQSGETIDEKDLASWVKKVSTELSRKKIRPRLLKKKLILAFISERHIRSLNKEFRKKNSVTDILSFAPVESSSLGELAICLSAIHSHPLHYLILHGILHLLGFEHEKGGPSAEVMYHLQDDVFERLHGN